MPNTIISTAALHGARVYDAKRPDKKIGKVNTCVFHPTRRLVVGFTVKRPDLAWMFHRSDLFVAFDSFTVSEGRIYVEDDDAATGKAACKRLGIDWDECIIWQGLPLMTDDEQVVGHVGNVKFDRATGQVTSLMVDQGASRDVLLGMAELPASHIQGFRFGVGDKLGEDDGDDFLRGALIVSAEALEVQATGGLAEKAGAASAVAAHKVSVAVDHAKPLAQDAAEKARATATDAVAKLRAKATDEAAAERAGLAMGESLGRQMAKTTEAAQEGVAAFAAENPEVAQMATDAAAKVNQVTAKANAAFDGVRPKAEQAAAKADQAMSEGAYQFGKQLGKTRGMFASFKESYRKALEDDES